jgi:hypothetical protein
MKAHNQFKIGDRRANPKSTQPSALLSVRAPVFLNHFAQCLYRVGV